MIRLLFFSATIIVLFAGCNGARQLSPMPSPSQPMMYGNGLGVQPNLSSKNVISTFTIPSPKAAPQVITTGPDGNLWFIETSTNQIGRLTPTGTMTQFSLPSGAIVGNGAGGLINGPNGDLWFTAGGYIGRLSTAGAFKLFPLPSGAFAGEQLTKGPDGNIWFTDQGTDSIGKMTPAGSITEYPVIGATGDLWGITVGPDNNLWFTSNGGGGGLDAVGKITSSGSITTFPTTGYVDLRNIIKGPDGNLYVAASNTGEIAQVTTSGAINIISAPVYLPNSLIVGPDKKVWIDGFSGQLVEFDPKTSTFSTIAQLPNQPRGCNPYGYNGLTLGPDGDVWITSGDEGCAQYIAAYEEKITTIGIRLNGEMSITDPNYGFELGYAVGTTATQTQTISLSMGESVLFQNVDTEPHSAAFLGNATSNSAPWPPSFNGSTIQSPAGTAIGTPSWATGSLSPNVKSPLYETGLPGFYMIGCQYHYNTNEMRTVIVVH